MTDGSRPCPLRSPFPVPPLPPCPAGFAAHRSGFWSNPDQKAPTGRNTTVAACGARCSAAAGRGKGCVGFEVYDPGFVTEPPQGTGSCCYTYTHGELRQPFTPDARGLIRTCTVAKQ